MFGPMCVWNVFNHFCNGSIRIALWRDSMMINYKNNIIIVSNSITHTHICARANTKLETEWTKQLKMGFENWDIRFFPFCFKCLKLFDIGTWNAIRLNKNDQQPQSQPHSIMNWKWSWKFQMKNMPIKPT